MSREARLVKMPRPWAGHFYGLSLVELLVTLALLTLVAGTTVATFTGGLAVWERMETQGNQEQWLQVAFDQFRRDLRSVRRFQPIPFEGAYDAVSFPTLVSSGEETDSEEVGRLGYFWDSGRHRLCRSEHPYRRLRRARLKDSCDAVLTEIDRLRFSYYTLNPHTEQYSWSNAWSSPEPPLAIKVEIGYHDQATRRPITQSLIVPLPAASTP